MDPNLTTSLSLFSTASCSCFFLYGLSLKRASFLKKQFRLVCFIAMSFTLHVLFPFPFSPLIVQLLKILSCLTCKVSHNLGLPDYSPVMQLHVFWSSVFPRIDRHIQRPDHVQFCLFILGKTIGDIVVFHQEAHTVQLSLLFYGGSNSWLLNCLDSLDLLGDCKMVIFLLYHVFLIYCMECIPSSTV